jgi:hypothetical protein
MKPKTIAVDDFFYNHFTGSICQVCYFSKDKLGQVSIGYKVTAKSKKRFESTAWLVFKYGVIFK